MLQGPVAPDLGDAGDALAWHEPAAPMRPNGMRRIRRTDVWLGEHARAPVIVDAMFRDTYMGDTGVVTIVHEYALVAEVDATDLVVSAIDATPRVLPYRECPEAAASAQRLVGVTTEGLRARVRAELAGASTCTHLNDALRGLEDAGALAAVIATETTP
jgi:hypothetical protein